METLRPNELRAKNAILSIWIVLALNIINLISSYFQYGYLTGLQNGEQFSEDATLFQESREGIVAFLYLIGIIYSMVVFILWFRRAYYNLHLRVKKLSHLESYAAYCWFIPFVNWYQPYQIMKELYHETKLVLLRNNITMKSTLSTSYLGVWWAIWVIDQILGQISFRYSLKAETTEMLLNSTYISVIENLIGIPLALVTIMVIKDYADVEPLLREIKDYPEADSNQIQPDVVK